MLEVGKEYWITYGTTEEQSFASVKVLAVDGSWIRVQSDKLDSHLNTAAPMFISARERDREVEKRFEIGGGSFTREQLERRLQNPGRPVQD